jgi:predicted amidohydrolase
MEPAMPLDLSNPVCVAAVQMQGRVADIAYNLDHAEKLATEAFEHGARIVALPEFFTTPISFDARLSGCALAADSNAGLDLLQRLARRYAGYVGGSMLVGRGTDVYNTYHFVQPDGTFFTHDKDLPTMWENAFYVGGSDDGVLQTQLGPVGAAVCWELIRTQTVLRLRERVRFVLSGSNWWTGPMNWPLFGRLLAGADKYNRRLAAQAPVTFAKLLGVPLLHAGQAGRFECRFLLVPGLGWSVPYASEFLGETKIIDRDGNVVASRSLQEGAGVVLADVLLEPGKPSLDLDPASFWIPKLPPTLRWYWDQQNACGKWYYRKHNAADQPPPSC